MAKTSVGKKSPSMLRGSPRLNPASTTRSSPRMRDSPTTRILPLSDRLSSTRAASPAETKARLTSGDGSVSREVTRRLLEETEGARLEASGATRSSPRATSTSSPHKTVAPTPGGRYRPVMRLMKRRIMETETEEVNGEERTARASPRSSRTTSASGESPHKAIRTSRAITGGPVFEDRGVQRHRPVEEAGGRVNGELKRSPVFEGVKQCSLEREPEGMIEEAKRRTLRVKLRHLKPHLLQEFGGGPRDPEPRASEEGSRGVDKPATAFLKNLAGRRSGRSHHEGETSEEPLTVGESTSRALRSRLWGSGVESGMGDDGGCSKCGGVVNLESRTAPAACKCRHLAMETGRGAKLEDEHRSQSPQEVVPPLENGPPSLHIRVSDGHPGSQESGSELVEAASSKRYRHYTEGGGEGTGRVVISVSDDTDKGRRRGGQIDWFAKPESVWLGYESDLEEYLCMCCGLQETSLSAILRHSICSPQMTRCDLCGAHWDSPCKERIHRLRDHQFVCHLCPKRFKTSRIAFKHVLDCHPGESVRRGSPGTYHGGPPISLPHLPRKENTVHAVLMGRVRVPPPDGSSPYIVANHASVSLSQKQAIEKYRAFNTMIDAYEAGKELSSSAMMCPLCNSIQRDLPGVEHHMSEAHRPDNSRELGNIVKATMMTRQDISMEMPRCGPCNKLFQNSAALRQHAAVVHMVSTPYRLALSQQKAKDNVQGTELQQERGMEEQHKSALRSARSSPSMSGETIPKIRHCIERDPIDGKTFDDTPGSAVATSRVPNLKSGVGNSGGNVTDGPSPSPGELHSALDGEGQEKEAHLLLDAMPMKTGDGIQGGVGYRNDSENSAGKAAQRPTIVKSRSDDGGGGSWDLPHCLFSLFSMRDCTPSVLQELDSQIERALTDLRLEESKNGGRRFSASQFQAGGPVAAYMKLRPVLENPPRTPTARQNYKTSHRYKLPMGHFSQEFEETPLFPTMRDLYTHTNAYRRSPLSILTAKEVRKSPMVCGTHSKKEKKHLAKKVSKALESAFMQKSRECIQAVQRGHTLFRRGYDMQSHSFLSDRVVAHISKKMHASWSGQGVADSGRVDDRLSAAPVQQRWLPGSSYYGYSIGSTSHSMGAPVPNGQQHGQFFNIVTSQGRMQIVVNSQGQTRVIPCPPSTSQPPAQGTETSPGLQQRPQISAVNRQVILLPRLTGSSSQRVLLSPLVPTTQAPGSASQPPGRLVLGTFSQSNVARLQQVNNGIRLQTPQPPPPPPLQHGPQMAVLEKARTVNEILAKQQQQQFIRPLPPPLQRAPSSQVRLSTPGTGRQLIIIQPMKKPVESPVVGTDLPGAIRPDVRVSSEPPPTVALSEVASFFPRVSVSVPQPPGSSSALHGDSSSYAAPTRPPPVATPGPTPPVTASVNTPAGELTSAAAQRPYPMRLSGPPSTEANAQDSVGAYLMRAKQTIFEAMMSKDAPSPCPPLVQMKPLPQGEQHRRGASAGWAQGSGQPPPEVIRISPEKKLVVKYKDGSSLTLPFGRARDGPVESKPATHVKTKMIVVKSKRRRTRSIEWYCRKLCRRRKYENKFKRKLQMGSDYSSTLKLTKTIRQVPIVTTNVLCRAVDADVVMKVSEAVRRGKRATITLDDYRHLCYRYFKTGPEK